MRFWPVRRTVPMRAGFALLFAGVAIAGCSSDGKSLKTESRRWQPACQGRGYRYRLSVHGGANRCFDLASTARNAVNCSPLSSFAWPDGEGMRHSWRVDDHKGGRRRTRAGRAKGRGRKHDRPDPYGSGSRRATAKVDLDQILFSSGCHSTGAEWSRVHAGRG